MKTSVAAGLSWKRLSRSILFWNWNVHGLKIFSIFLIHDSQTFFSTIVGASIGVLGGLIIYQVGSYVDKESKSLIKRENTVHIYELYKDELDMNLSHLNYITTKKGQIPFFKLKSITRNSFWGQLSEYSRDTDLMKDLNYIYGEFELINNKIDIINANEIPEEERIDKNKSLEEQVEPDPAFWNSYSVVRPSRLSK